MPIASAEPAVFAAVAKIASESRLFAEAEVKPFAEVFPQENIHHHFAGQDQSKGVYAKQLLIPAGFRLASHQHSYDHLSVLASGTATLEVDGVERLLVGPVVVTIQAGKPHMLRAETDVVWLCIHPTDETDAGRVDEAILEKAA